MAPKPISPQHLVEDSDIYSPDSVRQKSDDGVADVPENSRIEVR